MMRFDNDRDIDQESPEDKALLLFSENGCFDFLFEYDLSLFRCKINGKNAKKIVNGRLFPLQNSPNELSKIEKLIKVKLLCHAVPNMVRIYHKSSGSKQSFIYAFKAYSKHDPEGVSFEMPGSKVGSHYSFSTMLSNKVSFGFFEGSKTDYQILLRKMIDQCYEYGQVEGRHQVNET